MKRILVVIALAALLVGCENMYEDDGIPRLRNQRDVDAYNASVSSASEIMVCTRERVLGSQIRQFICMTQAQRDRLALLAREELEAFASGAVAQ